LCKNLFLALSSIVLFSGCTGLVEEPRIKNLNNGDKIIENIENTILLEEKKVAKEFNSNTIDRRISSIFKPREQSIEVGQIVTVNVSEKLKSSSKDNKKLSKTGSSSRSGGLVSNGTGVGVVDQFATKVISPLTSLGWENDKATNFSGTGSSTREDVFETTITAFISKKINDNIFKLEGFKEIKIDGQYQMIKISGYVRKRQLKDYIIDSTSIANFTIDFGTKGDVSENSEQNELGRAVDKYLF